MKIQVVSDLHLEFWASKPKFNFVKPSAPVLALLGDICCLAADADFDTFKRFIAEILPLYKLIIFVAGNHEYYYHATADERKNGVANERTMLGINAKVTKFFRETSKNLHFLNSSTIETEKFLIVGTTLWTWFPEDQRDKYKNAMNDYLNIYIGNNALITPSDVSKIHVASARFIARKIKYAEEKGLRVILLTHHKPYITPEVRASGKINHAYESDLKSVINKSVVLAAYGHTHTPDRRILDGTLYYSNPKGYPHQKCGYKPDDAVMVRGG